MKIVICEIEPREAVFFEPFREGHEVIMSPAPLGPGTAAQWADAEIVSSFIYSDFSAETLAQLKSLKLIATRSTGYDHIDIMVCAARGIAVANVPTYGENTVAEHVFALLLAISHRLRDAMERVHRGIFSPEGLEGFDLAGRCLGVVGTGHIGRHVIRIARGFEMTVLASDLAPDTALAQEMGFSYVPFETLLEQSDIITLHVPSSPASRQLLNANAFARMKDGVVIINTARGDLIDVRALIHYLREGKVAGAGLDVLPNEPLIREEAELISSTFAESQDLQSLVASHVLMTMPQVVITPHSAFFTREAVARIAETSVVNIEGFIAGTPCNLVTGPGDEGGKGEG